MSKVAMKASDLAQALMQNPDCEVGVIVHGRIQAVSGVSFSGERKERVVALFYADFIPEQAGAPSAAAPVNDPQPGAG